MAIDRCEEFFRSTHPPDDLQEVKSKVISFVEHHRKAGNKIVLVTSGGTLVPLEKHTVRHLDNFSTGMRGSLSAEEFLSLGYAVIFLHRHSSLHPYARVLHSQNSSLLDSFSFDSQGHLSVEGALKGPLEVAIRKYKEVQSNNLLLSVPFTSVFEYLHYLRHITQLLQSVGRAALVYLAAAVSDFYIHPKDMVEHKIQSSLPLVLKLDHVPKMLTPLVQEWAPNAFVVSFKLETDETLLVSSSKNALEKYHHQIVVANVLEKRKDEVRVVCKESVDVIRLPPEEKEKGIPIESKLTLFLKIAHSKYLQS